MFFDRSLSQRSYCELVILLLIKAAFASDDRFYIGRGTIYMVAEPMSKNIREIEWYGMTNRVCEPQRFYE